MSELEEIEDFLNEKLFGLKTGEFDFKRGVVVRVLVYLVEIGMLRAFAGVMVPALSSLGELIGIWRKTGPAYAILVGGTPPLQIFLISSVLFLLLFVSSYALMRSSIRRSGLRWVLAKAVASSLMAVGSFLFVIRWLG